jgi:hypothetical protein
VELKEPPKEATSILAAGHNPKETPEQFIEKVLKNQKRINHTIELYEENMRKQQLVDVEKLSEREAVA